MDNMPNFSVEKTQLESWLTYGQLIAYIDDFSNSGNLIEAQVKKLC